jgi:hypothetical protein
LALLLLLLLLPAAAPAAAALYLSHQLVLPAAACRALVPQQSPDCTEQPTVV